MHRDGCLLAEPLVSPKPTPSPEGCWIRRCAIKRLAACFAEQLARRIANYRFDDGGAEFQFEQADIFEIQAMIEGTVR